MDGTRGGDYDTRRADLVMLILISFSRCLLITGR
ncbi:hypothetical protein CA11_00190 [Gimesia maris]|nr:hypothetical protein CA11_00190 [Gimesia maris]